MTTQAEAIAKQFKDATGIDIADFAAVLTGTLPTITDGNVSVAAPGTLAFAGDGVTVTSGVGTATVHVPNAVNVSAGNVTVTAPGNLAFAGDGVTVANVGGDAHVTIPDAPTHVSQLTAGNLPSVDPAVAGDLYEASVLSGTATIKVVAVSQG